MFIHAAIQVAWKTTFWSANSCVNNRGNFVQRASRKFRATAMIAHNSKSRDSTWPQLFLVDYNGIITCRYGSNRVLTFRITVESTKCLYLCQGILLAVFSQVPLENLGNPGRNNLNIDEIYAGTWNVLEWKNFYDIDAKLTVSKNSLSFPEFLYYSFCRKKTC